MRLVKQLSLLLISPKRLNGLSSKGRGLYFGGRWVVATFLKLLSSNLMSKPYLGVNLNLWESILPTPLPGGGGLYFGVRWVVARFLKLLSSNLVCKLYLGANFYF